MKKINILRKAGFLLFFFFFSHLAMAQDVGDYRSIGNGNWTAASSWEIYNGLSWNNASEYPGQTSSSSTATVSVQVGSTISFPTPTGASGTPTPYSFGDLIINGTLNIGDGAVKDSFYISFPGTQSVLISQGSLFLRSNNGDSNLYLPTEATIFILNNGSIHGDVCNNSKNIYIGTLRYAACVGSGQTYTDFGSMNDSGGSLRAQPIADPQAAICGSNGFVTISSANTEKDIITYKWTLPAAGGWSGSTNIDDKTLGKISFSQPGQYLFKLEVTAVKRIGGKNYTWTDVQPLVVTVGQTNTVSAASSSPSVCMGSPISNITHSTTVANGIGQPGVSGANGLPGGVVAYWAQDKITISGTPTAAGIFNYSIPLTGGCGTASATGTITVSTKPAINAMAATICSGSVFNVNPVNGTNGTVPPVINYSWSAPAMQAGLSGGVAGSGSSISGTLSNPTGSALNAVYTVTPSSGSCGTGSTFTVTITVNPNVAITSQSTATQTKCIGAAFSAISVTATGTGLSYQWYSNATNSNSGGTSLGNSNGANTSSYTPQSTIAGTLYYYCVVSGTCGSSVTSAVSGAFVTNPNVAITSQSTAAQTQCLNAAFSAISVTATGTGLTYQWFSNLTASAIGGTSLNNANGAQTNSYTPQSTAAGTLYYYCVVSGTCGSSVTSAVSGAFVTNPILNAGVNITSSATTICAGSSVTFTANPTNGGTAPSYQWYNGVNLISGATASTYTTTSLNNNYQVSVVMTSNASPCMTGSPVTSNIITMTVNALPAVSVTGNNRICKNTDAVFTLTGTPGATVTYNINGINQTTVVLDGSGKATVTVSSAAVNQTLNIVSVSNGTCTNSEASSATVTVGEDSIYPGGGPDGWSKGRPDGNGLNAVIAGNYNTSNGNINACNCTVSGSLTVAKDTSIEIQNSFVNNGTVTVESDGNFKQVNDVPNPPNSGAIKVKRNIKFRNDSRQEYNYLISPVIGQSLKTIYPGVPTTATYPYVLYYNEANNYFYNSSGAYIAGRGLAVKEPTKADVPADNMDAVFNGVPGNGVISFPLGYTNNVQYGYNLVGNPYPSNIDLQKLYVLNGGSLSSPTPGKITSTIYFWDNGANNIYTQQGSGYSGRAYAVYNAYNDTPNKAGYLLNADPNQAIGTKMPNKIAKVGQGFMVRATGGGNLVFNNTIRHGNNAGAGFFSKGTQSPADRYWLKLVTPVNAVNTIAVVYFAGGSNAFGMDDSGMNGDSSDMLYSLAEGNKLQIEGKPMFEVSDKIILGSRHFAAGNYTFALDKAEGVFANGQHIYLKDKQTGIITNLSEGSYTFAANAGESTGRFEIIYQSETVLATDGTVKDDLLVYRDGDDFVIDSKGKKITQVEVYDSSGRLSLKTEPGSLKTVIPAISLSNGVYILKINQAGKITNRKIIR